MTFDCDVVVAGGGPAGSTTATALARAGRRVVLLERDAFPRFHIGESLLASINDVVKAIGATDAVERAGFPRKWGATFLATDGKTERFADFATSSEVPMPQTWQVSRAEFDHLLLKHSVSCGVEVRMQQRVLDASFDGDGVSVSYRPAAMPDGTPAAAAPPQQLRTRMFVDASGRSALLGRKFDLRIDEPRLANVALFSHYASVPRAEGRRAGDIRIVPRADMGWFWMIPISAELTSVGVVLPRAAFQALPRLEDQSQLDRLIAETPAVAKLMTRAERRWPVRVERDFSFGSRSYAGDRWVLVGDAGSFLDPVFSTGVAIAMESGLEAARAIDRGLSREDMSAATFDTYDRRQRARYLSFRRFVLGFYQPGFRELLFNPDPPPRMYRAVVTTLAGYWEPSLATRLWLKLFFLAASAQERFRFLAPTDRA